MDNIIDIGLVQLISAYIFVLILTIILRKNRIGKEQDLLIAVTRMTIQLVLVGYILEYIFGSNNLWLTLLALVIMEAFAIRNIFSRIKLPLSTKFKQVIGIAMVTGTLTAMIYFFLVVIGLDPWYEPRYVIPLAGMLIGNSMTGITLGAERLLDGIKRNRHLIEGALMLGANPGRATRDIVNSAFYAAILPTINSMLGMGIIWLPGLMTGQILSGISPLIAIKYQIAIMLGILGAVSLTVIILVNSGIKTFFNTRAQLVLPEGFINGKVRN